LGTHDQKVSVTFCDEDDVDDEDDEAEEVAVDDVVPLLDEVQPAASAVSAAAASAMAAVPRRLRLGERGTALWPPRMSFMAPPKVRTYEIIGWYRPFAGERQTACSVCERSQS
jgi:hypothetical protein